jgi:hypothetical protein
MNSVALTAVNFTNGNLKVGKAPKGSTLEPTIT